MNAPVPNLSEFTQKLLQGSHGATIEDLTRNYIGKRYTLDFGMKVVDEQSGKVIFQAPISYSHVNYAFVVLMETALVELLNKLTQLGQDIATGGQAEGGIPPTQ